jgi:hypothetical protein
VSETRSATDIPAVTSSWHLPPEEVELRKKEALLGRLADRLADREEEIADLQAEIERFEARYTMEVGRLYAEHDDVEALIAEEEFKLVPDDEEIKKRAEELRQRAEDSAARAREAIEKTGEKPTLEAKKAYHDLARMIHPDLAIDAAEKEKRHGLMTRLNAAYAEGNRETMDKLAEDLRSSPELVTGESIGECLVRVIRQIAQVKRRLSEIRTEMSVIHASEQFELYKKVEAECAFGRDLLAQMAERTKTHIRKSERRLTNLRNVNKAAEEYVKERFDMGIADFR